MKKFSQQGIALLSSYIGSLPLMMNFLEEKTKRCNNSLALTGRVGDMRIRFYLIAFVPRDVGSNI